MKKIVTLLIAFVCASLVLHAQTITRAWDFQDMDGPVSNRIADGWNINLYGSPVIENGILKLTAVATGGYCNINYAAPANGSIVNSAVSRRFQIRVKNETRAKIANFLWKVDGGTTFQRMEILMSTQDTDFKEYTLDLTHDLRWTGNISEILIQVPIAIDAASATENKKVEIDYLRFTESPTVAQLPAMVSKTPAPFGVNLSGGEFSFNTENWRYPRAQELDYLVSKGFKIVRLPFLWERVQPTLNGPLDVQSLSYLKNLVWEARARGIWVLLDLHNYNRRRFVDPVTNVVTDYIIGTPEVPIASIQDFWKQMAFEFKDFGNIYGYGIMNEPYSIPKEIPWVNTAQAIIDAIRTEDTHNTIMVGGDSYSSASQWPSVSDNLRKLKDPVNNLMYEAHVYFDKSAGGHYLDTYAAEEANAQVGVNRLTPFANWLKKYNLRGFIGEYGIPNNPNANEDKTDATDNSQWNTVLNTAMQYMKSQGIGGTAWSYGSSWGNNRLSVFPNSDGSERPQMQVLEQYIFADPVSNLPGISSAFVANFNVDNPVSYQLTATNNPTSFTVTGLPPTLTYDNTERKITGTISLGEYTITVKATNANGDGEVREIVLRGIESVIPGIIEAENYNSGGQNVGYFDNSVGNSGNNIYRDEDVDFRRSGTAGAYIYSVTQAYGGEWLKYTANVEEAGSYGVKLKYVTVTTGSVIKVKVDEVVVAEGIPLPVTQGLNDWKEAYFELPNVSVGEHTLTLEVVSGDVDFDNMNFNLIVPAEVPTNLAATAFGSKRVNLTWNASANSAFYIVERSEVVGGPYTVIAQNVVSNSYSDETVVGTTTYYYVVKGANSLGESAASTSVSITTAALTLPQQITGLTVMPGSGRVELNWTAVADVDHYNIKRSTTTGGPYTTIATATTVSYVDTDVVNNSTYYYVVSAENVDGEGDESVEKIAKPTLGNYAYYNFDFPAASSMTPATQITDSWGNRHGAFDTGATFGSSPKDIDIVGSAVVGGGVRLRGVANRSYFNLPEGLMSDVDNFTIGFWFRQVANQDQSRLFEFGVGDTYTSATPEADRKLMYLSARAGAGNVLTYGAQNGAVQKTLATSVSIPTVQGSVVYRHIAVTQFGSTVTIYLDGEQVGQSTDFTIKPSDLGLTTHNFIGKSRTLATTVDGIYDEFKIFNRALTPTEIVALKEGTLPVPAEVPVNPVATAFGKDRIDLTWDASSNATSYIVERSSTSGGPYTVVAQNITAASYSDENLASGTTYFYIIKGVNALGESAASSSVSATTEALTPPQQVTGLITIASSGKVELKWTEITNATIYNVKRSTTSGGPYTNIGTSTTGSYTDTDITNNTIYYYVISAQNQYGEGANSVEKTVNPSKVEYAYYTFDLTDAEANTFENVNFENVITDTWEGNHGSFEKPATGVDHRFISGNQSLAHISFLEPVNSKLGRSMRLRGRAGSYVRLPQGLMSDVNDFTISFWYRQVANQNGARLLEFSAGNGLPVADRKLMYLSARAGTGNVLTYGIQNGAVQKTLATSVSIGTGAEFRHYVVTQSGNTLTIYLDGVQIGQSTDFTIRPSDLGLTTDNYLGKSQTTVATVDGIYDEFKIFNKAITQSEVTLLYSTNTLPVSFLDFTAKKQNTGSVLLDWSTASEKDNSHFEILRSVDGKFFDNIANITGSNNSNELKKYQHTDFNPQIGINYYQLKQVDFNGKSSFHPDVVAVSVNLDNGRDLKIYHADQTLKLRANVLKASTFTLTLTDLSGRIVAAFKDAVQPGNNAFEFPVGELMPGIYVATYATDTTRTSVKIAVN